ATGSPARPDLTSGVDADGFQEAKVLDVDTEGGPLARREELLGARVFALDQPPCVAGFPAIDSDLRVQNHVEVVALFPDPLDRVVHATRTGDRFVDRLPELLEHFAKVVVQFHGRSDYRFRFHGPQGCSRKESWYTDGTSAGRGMSVPRVLSFQFTVLSFQFLA